MTSGILELDVHGMTTAQAMQAVHTMLGKANTSTYRIRIIHGFHGGTRIRDELREEFGYEREAKVRRIVPGSNQGITELVLREL